MGKVKVALPIVAKETVTVYADSQATEPMTAVVPEIYRRNPELQKAREESFAALVDTIAELGKRYSSAHSREGAIRVIKATYFTAFDFALTLINHQLVANAEVESTDEPDGAI